MLRSRLRNERGQALVLMALAPRKNLQKLTNTHLPNKEKHVTA
jgi:hypothetical protein